MIAQKKPLLIGSIFLVISLSVCGSLFISLTSDLPSIDRQSMRFFTPGVRVTDRNSRLLYEVLPGNAGRHNLLSLDQIPRALVQATVATEDRSFYQNPGVDAGGILRAAWINLQGGETIAGGSTITQQVARNLLLSPAESHRQTLRRKLREAYLAWLLTRAYSKDEIIGIYLNQTYYGEMTYGVDAAARTYFGRPASSLDLAEATLLAGIPQAPALYDPFAHPDKAKARQAVVLRLMEEQGYITPEERSMAEKEPLVYSSSPFPMNAPHFVLMALNRYDALASTCQIAPVSGAIVRTTLDLNVQQAAESAIRHQIAALRRNPGKDLPGEGAVDHNVSNAALVALDPDNGEVLALVGSADYADASIQGAVNMTLAPRQPGSTLKPFIYAAAFDPALDHHGQAPWTAASMILDVKTNFVTHDGQPYTPANYDNVEHGPVLARQALASSLNIPAVKALQFIGMDVLFDQLSSLGIGTLGDPHQYDLSLSLGGGEVSLFDLTSAYAAFASGGWQVSPQLILDVRDQDGRILFPSMQNQDALSDGCQQSQGRIRRVMDEKIAWLITDILADDEARLIGFGRNSALNLDRPAAVKTGTTSNFHDNWTVGFTPDLVAGVWVGNTDNHPMREVSGLTGAGPIWHEFMREALKNRPKKDFSQPAGMQRAEVCALSGLLPTPECPYRISEWFLPGTLPTREDTIYRRVAIDRRTQTLADATTPSSVLEYRTALDLPSSAADWARRRDVLLYSDLVLSRSRIPDPDENTPLSTPSVSILSPRMNAIYLFAPERPQLQRLPIEINLSGFDPESIRDAVVTVRVDEVDIPAAPPDYRAWWELQAGDHTVLAQIRLADGRTFSSEPVRFQVQP